MLCVRLDQVQKQNYEYKSIFYDGMDYSTGEMITASEAFNENYIEFIGFELLPTDECSIIMKGS